VAVSDGHCFGARWTFSEDLSLIQHGKPSSGGRRGFINYLLGTSLGATFVSILYPVIEFVMPPPVVEAPLNNVVAAQAAELKLNSGKIFKFGSQPGILIRTASGDLRAFSAICTHLNCTVQYREDLKHIWCACHNGHYDLNGKNVAGPPPRPLEAYSVKVAGDNVVVLKA
jgi:cytochrome b6-f complex iron-sulfur subunit